MMDQGTIIFTSKESPSLLQPKYSDWQCYLFGTKSGWGMVYRPLEGQEPNWFWRKMQFLVLGHRWVKEEK